MLSPRPSALGPKRRDSNSINPGLTRAHVALTGACPLCLYRTLVRHYSTLRAGVEFTFKTLRERHALTNTHCGGVGMMASASVVGQQHPGPHRLDPEPQILILKLRGAKKRVNLPRRSSWERMVQRRSSVDSAEEEAKPRPLSPSVAVTRGTMPAEGCGPPVVPAAPRSAEPDRRTGNAGVDGRPGESGSGRLDVDCDSDCDFNHNTSDRPWRSAGSVLPIQPKAAHRQRDSAQGRRDTWSGESRHQGILRSCSCSSVVAQNGSSLPPLQRLTQGRTGVVRLARTDPPRREAWSIFPGGGDPRMIAERGEGHRFEAKPVKQDWCDACNRQITAQALKCQSK